MKTTIRKAVEADLELFFHHQQDEEAAYMAAFTPSDLNDKAAYMKKWKSLLKNKSVNVQAILYDSSLVGSLAKFIVEGEAHITYAIKKECWGKGITTAALQQFLVIERTRPIYGRVAFDNFGSQRILEKAGFERIGKNNYFANAREMEIEEYIYRLT